MLCAAKSRRRSGAARPGDIREAESPVGLIACRHLPELHNLPMNDLFDTPPTTDPTDAVTLAHYAERA